MLWSVDAIQVTEADNSQVLLIWNSVVVLMSYFFITLMQENDKVSFCVFLGDILQI